MKFIKLFEGFKYNTPMEDKRDYLKFSDAILNKTDSEFESYNRSELVIDLEKYNIKNYTINDDWSIDVDGDVNLEYKKLEKIPFKFGKVTGDFNCYSNELISLYGCPYYVGGNFFCSNNRLVRLVGSPNEVGKNFSCLSNKLNSLQGMPLEIGGSFNCHDNQDIESFDSISNIEGYVYCQSKVDISKFRGYCKGFKNLIHGVWVDVKVNESKYDNICSSEVSIKEKLRNYNISNYTINDDGTIDVDDDVDLRNRDLYKIPFKFGKVTGNFDCSLNYIDSLKGCPYYVGGNFNCINNGLKSLKGSPVEIVGVFNCRSNELTSLKGMPLEIGSMVINYNPNLKSFNSISNIEGYVYCDDHLDISKFDGYCKGFKKLRVKDGHASWVDISI